MSKGGMGMRRQAMPPQNYQGFFPNYQQQFNPYNTTTQGDALGYDDRSAMPNNMPQRQRGYGMQYPAMGQAQQQQMGYSQQYPAMGQAQQQPMGYNQQYQPMLARLLAQLGRRGSGGGMY